MFPLPVDTDSHQLFDSPDDFKAIVSPEYTLLLTLQGPLSNYFKGLAMCYSFENDSLVGASLSILCRFYCRRIERSLKYLFKVNVAIVFVEPKSVNRILHCRKTP